MRFLREFLSLGLSLSVFLILPFMYLPLFAIGLAAKAFKLETYIIKRNPEFSLCYTLYSKDLMSDNVYNFERGVAEQVGNSVYIGYIYLMFPLILFMKKYSMIDRVMQHIVLNHWYPYAQSKSEINNSVFLKFTGTIGEGILASKIFLKKLYKSGILFYTPMVLMLILNLILFSDIYYSIPNYTPVILLFYILVLESLSNNYEGNTEHKSLPKWYMLSAGLFFIFTCSHFYYEAYVTTDLFTLIIMFVTILGGLGYPLAHELGHSKKTKNVGVIISTLIGLPFFVKIHNKGHHKELLKVDDITVAEESDSLIGYLNRQYKYLYTKIFSLPNSTENALLVLLQAFVVITLINIDVKLASTYLILGFVSLTILESINFIEHIGLMREEKLQNRSWDSNNWFTNGSLFNVGKHSDHHLNPSKCFNDLECVSDKHFTYGYISALMLLMYSKEFWLKIVKHPL